MTSPPRRRQLTRERIVDAAIALADEQGIRRVGMRSVARRLGVDPMSLYNHVDGKKALYDGIAERVLAMAELPGREPWDAWARTAALRIMAVALDHPGAFEVFGSHPVQTPDAVAHLEPFLAELLDAGFPAASCALIVNAFLGFVASYAILRTAQPLTPAPSEAESERLNDELRARLPSLAALADADVAIEPDATFDLGVELLIDGLRVRLQRERPNA